MATTAPRRPACSIYLVLGDDGYRARLRDAELVGILTSGADRPTDLAAQRSADLGAPLGLTRHDARVVTPATIVMSMRSQGLFDAVDERRVIVVEHAEALAEHRFIAETPPDAALVLVTTEKVPARGRRPAKSARPAKSTKAATAGDETTAVPTVADLPAAVEAAGGVVERVGRLLPPEVAGWIRARAVHAGVTLAPEALAALADAVGTDSERIDHELRKLGAFAGAAPVSAADVRALVSGAIGSDIFLLTQAVVRRDHRTATAQLEQLLDEGQAPQQIIALLLWQMRVLLFATAMRTSADAERMAKAIRSSPYAIQKAQAFAQRVTRADITRAYETIYATDLAIKTGRTDERTAMLLCVLDLCGVASADMRELVVGEPPRR
ncbi:MAG TPA: DNA polymerase III subunit delta [Candidatus Saccharimonadales bacterium]|nr:DNA polymerase III subunit delta [Candidatus Saccharimonadales bacterium]